MLRLDDVLQELGAYNEIPKIDPRFYRSDLPPEKIIPVPDQLIDIPNKSENGEIFFPFDMGSTEQYFSLPISEAFDLQSKTIDQLIVEYEILGEKFDRVFSKQHESRFSNYLIERRKLFYSYLLRSLLESPKSVSQAYISALNDLRKLWNSEKNLCITKGCCKKKVFGSDYCRWHIHFDPNQKIFGGCRMCNRPMLLMQKNTCSCTKTHRYSHSSEPIIPREIF